MNNKNNEINWLDLLYAKLLLTITFDIVRKIRLATDV